MELSFAGKKASRSPKWGILVIEKITSMVYFCTKWIKVRFFSSIFQSISIGTSSTVFHKDTGPSMAMFEGTPEGTRLFITGKHHDSSHLKWGWKDTYFWWYAPYYSNLSTICKWWFSDRESFLAEGHAMISRCIDSSSAFSVLYHYDFRCSDGISGWLEQFNSTFHGFSHGFPMGRRCFFVAPRAGAPRRCRGDTQWRGPVRCQERRSLRSWWWLHVAMSHLFYGD